jgi:hypothetical protein
VLTWLYPQAGGADGQFELIWGLHSGFFSPVSFGWAQESLPWGCTSVSSRKEAWKSVKGFGNGPACKSSDG